MLARNRFILLLAVGLVLAVLSFSLQYLQLMPTSPVGEEVPRGKSRKRVNPVVHTEAPEPDPIADAYRYCNLPNQTEHTREGHSPADYKLLSVHVMIRHGDRYPLYSIPQTKRPAIDCTLSPNRCEFQRNDCSPIDERLRDHQYAMNNGLSVGAGKMDGECQKL
ncbi:hypothetical protein AOLI_G00297910 [Acnodon oligacanthus]